MADRSLRLSEKSNTSSSDGYLTGNAEMEYFWCFELNEDHKRFKWIVSCEDEDDEDFIEHVVFVKLAVLDGAAIAGEQNVVEFESEGQDGELHKGSIANLTKGVNPMATLNFSINGKIGGTFTLAEGRGPVTISGNHLLEFPQDENLDFTQADADKSELVVEEEDKKSSKSAKQKVASVVTKRKKSNKDDDTDDDDDDSEKNEDESEEDDDDDDDDDDESEDEIIMKPAKKVKDTGKKVSAKPDKETAKKPAKKQKK